MVLGFAELDTTSISILPMPTSAMKERAWRQTPASTGRHLQGVNLQSVPPTAEVPRKSTAEYTCIYVKHVAPAFCSEG
jgi:hypothetical protein